SSHFEDYVDIKVEAGRGNDIMPIVNQLEAHWDHARGYSQLGAAAYRAGEPTTAERLLIKLKTEYEDWRRCEEISFLARIWHEREDAERARSLLLDCLSGLADEAKEASGS